MPYDLISLLLYFTSTLSILGMGLVAYGYRWSLYSTDKATKWFATSMVLLSTIYLVRRLIWDLYFPLVHGVHFEYPIVNLFLNILIWAPVYSALATRYYLIPIEQRHKWRWWNAWAHPNAMLVRPGKREREDEYHG